MPYTPVAYKATEPLDTEEAKTAAAEFREIKRFITKVPQNPQPNNYTCVLADAGKDIFHAAADTTTRTYLIPDNATVPYDIGTVISFTCQHGAGDMLIGISGTDILRLCPTGTTGTRTLVPNGVAIARKITTTEWQIAGTGLS